MAPKLTSEAVQAEVNRFWAAFTSKEPEMLTEFYAPQSSVFSTSASRAEPGRLAAARREREYFNSQTTIRSDIGPIEVTMLADDVAVAVYTFQFHATKVSGVFGKNFEETIKVGRATQVFTLDSDGNLRVIHEHLSVPAQAD
jgi:ketosteroid isomerase-like protein